MSIIDYGFGQGSPAVDQLVSKQYPSLVLNGLEVNGSTNQFIEVSGQTWITTNAIWNSAFAGFQQTVPGVASSALVISPSGAVSLYTAPVGATLPITWGVTPISSPNAQFNIASFGAATGLSDSSAAIALANTAALATGGAVVIPTGSFTVAKSTTISAPIVFSAGGILAPTAGVTISISGSVQAPLSKIFTVGAGVISFIYGRTVYPEWWGAIPSASGDMSPYIQAAINALPVNFEAAGVVELQGTLYAIGTTLVFQKAGAALRGQGRNTSMLYCTTVGMDALYVSAPGTIVPQLGGGGTNPPSAGGTATMLQWPRVEKLTILQPNPSTSGATGGGYGITLCYTAEALLEDLLIQGFRCGVSYQRATNTNSNRIDTSNTLAGTNATFGGYLIDGSPQVGDNNPLGGNASARWTYCTHSGGGNVSGYGFKVYCSNTTLKGTVGDLHFYNPETNFCQYGMTIDMSQVLIGVDGCSDIFITNATLDTCYMGGIQLIGFVQQPPVVGVIQVTQHMNVSIIGGWLNSYGTGSVSLLAISNCRGVNVTGTQFFAPGTALPGIITGITIVDSYDVTVTGCTFDSMDHWVLMSKTTYAPGFCTFTGNRFYGSADGTGAQGGHTPNPGVLATGYGNSFTGNTFNGLYGAGIVTALLFDSQSSFNIAYANTFNKQTAAPLGGGTAVAIVTNSIVNSGTSNNVSTANNIA